MGFTAGLMSALRDVLGMEGLRAQRPEAFQRTRDWRRQTEDFSVEAIISDTLTNLACMDFRLTITGETERARLLAETARDFTQGTLEKAMSIAFVTGDSITVPLWRGDRFSNAVVGRDQFAIALSQNGEISAVAYLVEERRDGNDRWQLVQVMRKGDGVEAVTRVLRNGRPSNDRRYPDWREMEDWRIPNADRLPIGRYRCFMVDKTHPNDVYGAPICVGASKPIEDIHYYYSQLRNEFELSEKAVIASKAMFAKDPQGNLILPKGQDRLFMAVRGGGVDENSLKEWAPTIQAQVYLDAIDAAAKLLEKCVGVDSGIVSTPNEVNYANVDAVRKSMKNTQAFIDRARDEADRYIEQMLYSWNLMLDANGFPTGDYLHEHDWSDEYLQSHADKRESIVAGYALGATDAYDYRTSVLGEAPEIALERLEQIRGSREVSIVAGE